MTQSGDRCSACCRGRMTTRTSKACGSHQVRYLRCNVCGAQARSVVTAEKSWRRGDQTKVV